jgi:hypothetical protein
VCCRWATGAVGEGTAGVNRCDLVANLRSYLADQHLANVELVRADERPQQIPGGKFRQVIVDPPGGTPRR